MKITLELLEDDLKKLEEIQAYFGWPRIESAGQFVLGFGLDATMDLIKFDKENKGK